MNPNQIDHMAAQQHLSKAPVREALIDIQFEPRVSVDIVQKFAKSIEGQFSKSSAIWEASFGLENTDEGGPQTKSSHSAVGCRLDMADPPRVLQCRAAGFTFSRLSPYGEWTEFRDDAFKWWKSFLEVLPEITVTRIGVRYINEIKLPMNLGDFSEYLTCPPTVPAQLPQALSGFLSRVVIPDDASNSVSVVTQVFEGNVSESTNSLTILLDIDVFRAGRIDGHQSEGIVQALDTLRDQKNRMFFEHLTEKTIGMFQ